MDTERPTADPLPASPRIAVVGGGPGGLFLATLVQRAIPGAAVTVFERNRRTDAFGFGVVFSDATLRAIDAVDPVLRDALRDHGRHWDRIEVLSNHERHGFDGNGMSAIHRKVLLGLLQANAEKSGVELRFGTVAPPLAQLQREFDLVVGADGTNSSVRAALEAGGSLGHEAETAAAKFIWFGTTHLFDGLTFVHRVSDHGNFAVHGYPISHELSTFIVETDEETWRRAGMDRFDVTQPPGPSDTETQAYLTKLFADDIDHGQLVANNSRWGNFVTRHTRDWWRGNVVLLGDAVHTAHFSVGSGTKMAMEDAAVLADQLGRSARDGVGLADALEQYQTIRKTAVGKIQRSARTSLAWWEHFGTYQRTLDPLTFTFHFVSRSIGVTKMALRDPRLVDAVRAAWVERHGAPALESTVEIPSGDGAATLGRRLELVSLDGGTAHVRDLAGRTIAAPAIEAPAHDSGLAEVSAQLPSSGAVVLTGRGLSRTLLAEEARLRRRLVTILAGPDLADEDAAETALLAGRADAVASPQRTVGAAH
jgi:anthraniloyl-CoA monooxygenase